MNPIQIKNLLNNKRMTQNELCAVLFPDIKYPKHALKRVLSGHAMLDEVQIQRLSFHLKCSIDELYKLDSWSSKPHKSGVLVLSKDGHTAMVDPKRGVAVLYFKDDAGKEEILFTGTTTVSQLTNQLTKSVNKHERAKN